MRCGRCDRTDRRGGEIGRRGTALRLHDSSGYSELVLALMDGYTGARWSELMGLQPHEYDEVNKAIRVREPLAEAKGRLVKDDRTKTPVGVSAGPSPSRTGAPHRAFPEDAETIDEITVRQQAEAEQGAKIMPKYRPETAEAPLLEKKNMASDLH